MQQEARSQFGDALAEQVSSSSNGPIQEQQFAPKTELRVQQNGLCFIQWQNGRCIMQWQNGPFIQWQSDSKVRKGTPRRSRKHFQYIGDPAKSFFILFWPNHRSTYP
eukprot:scaffold1076_cov81-Cylindrotheca_fusiformis.AAC.2